MFCPLHECLTRVVLTFPYDCSSVSSSIKTIILSHFRWTHQINSTGRDIDRHVDNNRLLNLLTQSPHTPVEGCTTTTSARFTGGLPRRRLVLTDAQRQSFVAWILIMESPYINNNVHVWVKTTESAVSDEGGVFKDRFPVTYRLARVVLGAVISAILFDQ
ncbi:unnamed protein product [Vitrella brassicaformis CCMP3155]|uniref:Uncharacterized protein n=1 Tax=Vitrella brassicaformis (strain CCMP3155) TaxID=1169540 RepID=A0A0G4FBE9_VITBC|nr:unnamed protein product [Vitrella brassicaformis CCMP3155]|eukprot:CEM10284.1 unnamed protein product [Vitrella brassicaformis CCMP3155]